MLLSQQLYQDRILSATGLISIRRKDNADTLSFVLGCGLLNSGNVEMSILFDRS